jgi:hypothetical protein
MSTPANRFSIRALLFALSVIMAACGPMDPGDESDEEEDVETTEAALVANLMDAEEVAYLNALNTYRASKGLSKVRASIALTRAANAHSKDMATNLFMSHDSSDGTDPWTRIKKYYNYSTALGEIVAYGYTTGQAVFDAWKNSPPHNTIMLGADYKVVGISRVQGSNGSWYWTGDFGGQTDALLSAGFSTIASNGGFESTSVTTGVSWGSVTALSKWHLFASAGGSSTRKTTSAAAGSYGLRNADPNPGHASATQLLRAAAGVNYGVSVKTRRISGPSAQAVYLDFLDKDKKRISVYTASTGTSTSWTTVSRKQTSPAGTRYLRIILYGGSGAGATSTFDYDSVVVTSE